MLSITPKLSRHLLPAILFTSTLTSCLNPHMINRWVAHRYTPDAIEPAKTKSNAIVITSKLPDMGPQLSTTEKKWTHVIPAIVYWHFDYQNTCSLNCIQATYGYAVTCHKAQGGEWDDVFLFLDKKMYGMSHTELFRWSYTAVTRAKRELNLENNWWIE